MKKKAQKSKAPVIMITIATLLIIGIIIGIVMEQKTKVYADMEDYYYLNIFEKKAGDAIEWEENKAPAKPSLETAGIPETDQAKIAKYTKFFEDAKQLLRDNFVEKGDIAWDRFEETELICYSSSQKEISADAMYTKDLNCIVSFSERLDKLPDTEIMKVFVHELIHSLLSKAKDTSIFNEGVTEYLAIKYYPAGTETYSTVVEFVRVLVAVNGADAVVTAFIDGTLGEEIDRATRPGTKASVNLALKAINIYHLSDIDAEICAVLDAIVHYAANTGRTDAVRDLIESMRPDQKMYNYLMAVCEKEVN